MVSAHEDGWNGHFAFSGVVLVECAELQVLSRTSDCVQVGLVADGLVVFFQPSQGRLVYLKKRVHVSATRAATKSYLEVSADQE